MEELYCPEGGCRSLRKEEGDLLEKLLQGRFSISRSQIDLLVVVDMRDGGMGGVQFCSDRKRNFGKQCASARYIDADGVMVSIVVNLDESGGLFEIDFWKVDFSALQRYPKPGDVEIIADS